MPEPTVISEIELGSRGVLRSVITELGGRRFCDVRLWVTPRARPGELVATKKGVAIPLEHVGELVESLQAVASIVSNGSREAAGRAG